jgi:hypothetical protein
MDWLFSYDTYQDVRKNLFRYSIVSLNAAGFLVFNWIFPSSLQKWILSIVQMLTAMPLLHYFSGIVVLTLIAYVLTEIIQIHDRWYDRFIIRWRFRYATDFILPRLIHPFASRVNYRFHQVAEDNIGEFQENLYYPFVGDRDNKIGKNLLVRFYERVTVYWLTQINEIVIVACLLVALWFAWSPSADQAYTTGLLRSIVVLLVAFFLNRVWIWTSLESVRHATEEEIKAIHASHNQDLENRLRALCNEYGVPYV